jgi:hypothetical protein
MLLLYAYHPILYILLLFSYRVILYMFFVYYKVCKTWLFEHRRLRVSLDRAWLSLATFPSKSLTCDSVFFFFFFISGTFLYPVRFCYRLVRYIDCVPSNELIITVSSYFFINIILIIIIITNRFSVLFLFN